VVEREGEREIATELSSYRVSEREKERDTYEEVIIKLVII